MAATLSLGALVFSWEPHLLSPLEIFLTVTTSLAGDIALDEAQIVHITLVTNRSFTAAEAITAQLTLGAASLSFAGALSAAVNDRASAAVKVSAIEANLSHPAVRLTNPDPGGDLLDCFERPVDREGLKAFLERLREEEAIERLLAIDEMVCNHGIH